MNTDESTLNEPANKGWLDIAYESLRSVTAWAFRDDRFRDNTVLTKEDIDLQPRVDLLGPLPRLEKLDLSDSGAVGRYFSEIIERAPNVREINANWCPRLDDIDFNDEASLERLQKFSADYCESLTYSLLLKLLKRAPNLETINISSSSLFRPDVAIPFDEEFYDLGSFESLKEINFSDTEIDVTFLAHVIKRAPKLHDNKGLLLDCLSRFSEYNPAAAYIAKLLIEKHRDSLTTDELKKAFSIKCTRHMARKLFAMLGEEQKKAVIKTIIDYPALVAAVEEHKAILYLKPRDNDELDSKNCDLNIEVTRKILSFIDPSSASWKRDMADLVEKWYVSNPSYSLESGVRSRSIQPM